MIRVLESKVADRTSSCGRYHLPSTSHSHVVCRLYTVHCGAKLHNSLAAVQLSTHDSLTIIVVTDTRDIYNYNNYYIK